MQVQSFAGKGIHGYLNPRIKFHPRVTFLTGINGTGKTSIVRCVIALLQPSLPYLLEIEFKDIHVTVRDGNRVVRVWAQKNARQLTLGHGKSRSSLKIALLQQEQFESSLRFRERWTEFVAAAENGYASHPVMQFLRALPTPMFLGLERRSEAETAEERPIRSVPRRFRGLISGNLYQSLVQARGLAENTYRLVLTQIATTTNELRQNLILSAFSISDLPSSPFRQSIPAKTPTVGYVEKLRAKRELVTRTFETLGIESKLIDRTVRGFFRRLEAAANRLPKGRPFLEMLRSPQTDKSREAAMVWISLRPQEERIDQVYSFVEKYTRDVETIRAHIDQYLTAVNSFLVDSQKKLSFASNGDLQVEVGNIGDRPVTALSSGESHLFVILTHLYFNPRRDLASVLIIDEPELSLHIKWQEIFVDAVTSAKPNLQLILATHSPSIILDRESKCIDLSMRQK